MTNIKSNFEGLLIFFGIIGFLSGITILILLCDSFFKSSFIYNNVLYPDYDLIDNQNNNGEIEYIVEFDDNDESDTENNNESDTENDNENNINDQNDNDDVNMINYYEDE